MHELVFVALALLVAIVFAAAVVAGRNPPGRKRRGCGGSARVWR